MIKSLKPLALAAIVAVQSLSMGPLPAAAHHGWGSFETTRAYYIQGTVTEVRWGDTAMDTVLSCETGPSTWWPLAS